MSGFFRIILVALAAALTGCTTTHTASQEENVSSIPWNRPQSWEGQGAFGGMMPGNMR